MKKIHAFRPRSIHNHFDPFFSDFLHTFRNFDETLKPGSYPAINIIENEKGYTLEVALPGYTKDEVDIELKDQVLTISVKNELESDGNSRYRLREFHKRNFSRSFKLNEQIDVEKIQANFDNGILVLNIEKRAELLSEPKKIQIA